MTDQQLTISLLAKATQAITYCGRIDEAQRALEARLFELEERMALLSQVLDVLVEEMA